MAKRNKIKTATGDQRRRRGEGLNIDRARWNCHRCRARRAGIPFRFTFDDWMTIWIESGHYHERGQRGDQYCMARFGDKGGYEKGNVYITTQYENNSSKRPPWLGRTDKPPSFLGKKHSKETKEKIRLALLGKPGHKQTDKTKKKIRMANLGRRHSKQSRAKMKMAWRRRRRNASKTSQSSSSRKSLVGLSS